MIERVVLAGDVVTLRPMTIDDVDALVAAANEDRTTYGFTPVPDGEGGDARATSRACLVDERAGWALPFVTTLTDDGRVVGSTRFLDLDDWGPERRVGGPPLGAVGIPRTAEIGATWLAASAQRTAVNTEAKLLMLRHAFDTWDVERITFKTDARNARSRAAIERVGAQFEGIRRAHVRASDGGIRDTAYYSIIRSEWPAVRDGPRSAPRDCVAQLGRGRRAERDADALDDGCFLLAGALRGRGHRLGEVDEPGAHLGRLGDRELGDGRGRGLQLGERLVDDLLGRRPAVALRRVAGIVALGLVGDGGDELGGRAVVARAGQRLGRRRRLLEQGDRAVLGHGHDGHGHVERRLATARSTRRR